MDKSKLTEKSIALPIKPMSINACFQGRRYKTSEYKAWREEMGWMLKKHKSKPIKWCDIEFNFYVKNYGKIDIDNLLKPLLDALVESKIIEDDRYVKSIWATKYKADVESVSILIAGHELDND